MLKVNKESTSNRQISRDRDLIVWAADIPGSPDKYVALFNARSPEERAGGAVAPTAEGGLDAAGGAFAPAAEGGVVAIAEAGGLDPGAAGVPAVFTDQAAAHDAAESGLDPGAAAGGTDSAGSANVAGDGAAAEGGVVAIAEAGGLDPGAAAGGTDSAGSANVASDGAAAEGGVVAIAEEGGLDPGAAAGGTDSAGSANVAGDGAAAEGGVVAIAEVGPLDSGVAGDPAAGIDTTVAMDTAAPSCGCIVAVDLSAIGIQGPARVTDLWHQKDLGIYDKEFSREIPFHGAGLYRVSPVR